MVPSKAKLPSRVVRLVEIAELFDVSKQRAHQLVTEPGFPAPLAGDARGRLFSRYEVQGWAKGWRAEKPWRYCLAPLERKATGATVMMKGSTHWWSRPRRGVRATKLATLPFPVP
jgi:hypothetical protein